jgi:hypothetical protein
MLGAPGGPGRLRRIRGHLTYANVVSTIALFIVFGGVSYAAFHLPKNSVRSKNIVNHQVKGKDLVKPSPIQAAGLVAALDCSSTGPNQWISQNPDVFGNVGYYRDLDGQVHLAGTTQKCGSPSGGAVVFVLPPGYRPEYTQEQTAPVVTGGPATTTNVIAFDGGEISVNANSKDAVSLAGISFRCAPPGTSGCPKPGN